VRQLRDHGLMAEAAGPGAAIVFVHGIGGAARIWQEQLSALSAAGHTSVAVNLLGYGGRAPIKDVSFDQLAADVEAAIAAIGLDRPILIGHSLGGMVAQTMLRRRPAGYRAAVLCCTSPAFGSASGDFQKKFVADRLGPLKAGRSMSDLAGTIVDEIMGPKPDPAGRAEAVAIMGATPNETYAATIHCIVGFDERANLANITIPILCLAAEHDRNAPPAMMQRMAGKIPGAKYLCLAGVGHLPNLEAPRAFDTGILDFLRDAFDRPRTKSHNP
jgi:3-oxoadipate enol-lactonase